MEINGGFFSRIFLHPKLINSQLLSAQTHMYYSAFTPSLSTPTYVKRSPALLPTPPPHLFPSVESDGKKNLFTPTTVRRFKLKGGGEGGEGR